MAALNSVLVLGGAGFIGSHIVRRFLAEGCRVTAIDGLAPATGGHREHLAGLSGQIRFIPEMIENVPELPDLVRESDLIVDCMAWTAHRLAIREPLRDLRHNVESHIHLIGQLPEAGCPPIVYLGSRGQYGRPAGDVITEDTPMVPEDIQGIHKLAAESHFRVYAKLKGFSIASLRFPNCYGERQPLAGDDIGLIGGFIRDILSGRAIELYGEGRRRAIVYAGDLAEIIVRLARQGIQGFQPYNVGGAEFAIEEIVRLLIDIIGRGGYVKKELPPEIRAIDIGNARFADDRLRETLGGLPASDLRSALTATVNYFKDNLS